MIVNPIKFNFSCLSCLRQNKFLSIALFALFFAGATGVSPAASFVTYSGGTSAESDWQAAAGTTLLEDFESYSIGAQISSLPALGIEFDSLGGGGFPNIYNHPPSITTTPYGSRQLANFPNGLNEINRYDDIVLRVLPGYEITALGFWNGDGQAATLNATVYDASDNLLGSIGAFKGAFAGFTSDVAVSRIVFDGNTGDGFNHLDGLQTNASIPSSSVPEPTTTGGLMMMGLLGLAAYSRRGRKSLT